MIFLKYFIGLCINNGLFFARDLIRSQNKSNPSNYLNIFRYIMLTNPYLSYSSCIAGFLETTWENHKCKVCDLSDSGLSHGKYYFFYKYK